MKLIYIIEDGRGNKKIGMTMNIQQRVNQLKTALPNGIISVMISEFMENAREIEKRLHEANKPHQLNGEWFSKIVDFCGVEFYPLDKYNVKDWFNSCEFHRKVSYVHLNASTPIAASTNRISLTSALRSYSIANSQCSFHDYVESANEFS